MKKIAILTSGGDAPGMNPAIRAAVKQGLNAGLSIVGIKKGYEGLFSKEFTSLNSKDVSGIINYGGTILRTARCEEMMQPEGVKKAFEIIKDLGIEGLIVIGGDGSLTGAKKLSDYGLPVIGIPGTIDLDLDCTEYTIGFDTAVNTAVDAIGRIRDTSSSHDRCSVIEVMGRNCGYLAVWSAITSGACAALVPEVPEIGIDNVIERIIKNRLKGKTHNIVVVAEGVGNSYDLTKQIETKTGIESRSTVLGHLQRGGPPTVLDRKHATAMGSLAVEALLSGNANKITILKNGKYELIDIEEGLNYKREFDRKLFDMVSCLSL